jgi:hypothetical protein
MCITINQILELKFSSYNIGSPIAEFLNPIIDCLIFFQVWESGKFDKRTSLKVHLWPLKTHSGPQKSLTVPTTP